ncbi:M23 family metallopeptidase [Roseococcus sp. SYP-B2431]|uniref:M23 family metallopeptidase n=1 Tax=Roseococcus sp. SYP-B2431 TaxID=2496640 RepID=UPI0010390D04|nr:M23 family metallopeptidase [Roseococcus sp. SYP-B2431]TCH98051.1 M23 family metallopeptidase [Roseococcus sp. SYP-B2431]
MKRRAALALPALLLARPAAALEWRGHPTQGAMLLGRGAAGARLALERQAVRVSPEGLFVLGFGRDHGPRATLTENGTPRTIEVTPRQWDVQHINGLPPAQVTPDAATLQRIVAERERLAVVRGLDTPRTDFAAGLAWPARGRISGIYGSQRILNGQPRQPHAALDIAGPVGTPIQAACSGRVTLAAEFHFFGKLLVLDHGHGVNTLYAHLSTIDVAEGQEVRAGQRIAAMGATGRVTGPHLHFGLSWYRLWLDPQPLLPA